MNSVSYNLDLIPDDLKERVKVALESVMSRVVSVMFVDDVKIIFNTDAY